MNDLKNMLILHDLPSNLIKEAYIVLNPNLKIKIQNKNTNKSTNELVEGDKSKDYILKEAKYTLLNYIAKYETKNKKSTEKFFEKKYKNLKIKTILLFITFTLYIFFTICIK